MGRRRKKRRFVQEPGQLVRMDVWHKHQLEAWHVEVKAKRNAERAGPGTELYSLLASIGATMDNATVRAATWERIERRVMAMRGESEDVAEQERHLDSIR